MKNGFGLPSGCLFSLCQNMSLPPSFIRLEKSQKLLSSEGLAWANFREFQKVPVGKLLGRMGAHFSINCGGPRVVCKAQDFTIPGAGKMGVD